jgi:NitT/TauT family transport system substrate-binding protein
MVIKLIRPLRGAAVALAMLVFATACGGAEPEPGSADAKELQEVRLLLPSENMIPFFAPVLADELGYFEEEGLKVTWQSTDGSSTVIQQLISGGGEFGLAGVGTLIEATAQYDDLDLISTYTYTTKSPYRLITLKDSGFTRVGQLAGKTIGVSVAAGDEAAILRGLLEANDVEAEIVEAGTGNPATLALQNGRIQAYISSYPNTNAIEKNGVDLNYIGLDKFEDFFDTSVVVKRELAESSPELIIGLNRAIAKATVFADGDTEAALKIIEKRYPAQVPDFDQQVLDFKNTLQHRMPVEAADGQWGFLDADVWQMWVDFLREKGTITEPIDPEQMYTDEFTEAINDFDESAIG